MIKFDSTHTGFDQPIKAEIGKKIKNVIVAGVLVFSIFSLSGCINKCDIKETHLHKYVSNEGFVIYVDDNTYGNWRYRGKVMFYLTDDYILVNEEEKKLNKFVELKDLIKISDNEKAISDFFLTSKLESFYEYEYFYHIHGYKGTSAVHYNWTQDSTHSNLTGKIRVSYPVYYGYNIMKEENGDYSLIKSKPYTNYDELVNDGYEYINASIQEFIKFEVVNEIDDDQIENRHQR